jgi:hypothetical protein
MHPPPSCYVRNAEDTLNQESAMQICIRLLSQDKVVKLMSGALSIQHFLAQILVSPSYFVVMKSKHQGMSRKSTLPVASL